MKFVRNLQRHALPDYCNYSSAASAVAGKDILLLVYDDNDELLAIAGQRSLTLNRSADTVEVSSKDTEGGWKSSIAGMKEWSIETDGLYVASDTSMKKLSKAFRDSDPVCLVIKNIKTGSYMFGGQAAITDFPLEAPYDDALTYSITLSGNGPLVDLSSFYVTPMSLTIRKPASGSQTATATISNAQGTLSAECEDRYITPTISGNTLTVSVSSDVYLGDYTVQVKDTRSGSVETVNVAVHVIAQNA